MKRIDELRSEESLDENLDDPSDQEIQKQSRKGWQRGIMSSMMEIQDDSYRTENRIYQP